MLTQRKQWCGLLPGSFKRLILHLSSILSQTCVNAWVHSQKSHSPCLRQAGIVLCVTDRYQLLTPRDQGHLGA